MVLQAKQIVANFIATHSLRELGSRNLYPLVGGVVPSEIAHDRLRRRRYDFRRGVRLDRFDLASHLQSFVVCKGIKRESF